MMYARAVAACARRASSRAMHAMAYRLPNSMPSAQPTRTMRVASRPRTSNRSRARAGAGRISANDSGEGAGPFARWQRTAAIWKRALAASGSSSSNGPCRISRSSSSSVFRTSPSRSTSRCSRSAVIAHGVRDMRDAPPSEQRRVPRGGGGAGSRHSPRAWAVPNRGRSRGPARCHCPAAACTVTRDGREAEGDCRTPATRREPAPRHRRCFRTGDCCCPCRSRSATARRFPCAA